MRVTQSMLYQSTVGSLQANLERLQKVSLEVSSTKRLNKPSDDPPDVRSSVKVRDGLAELQQYLRNIDTASRWVNAADTALGNAGDLLQRANEIAVQAANGSLSPSDRAAAASEVQQIAAALLQDASAKAGDQYIFSGFRVDRPPYASIAGATVTPYQGDTGVLVARIGADSTMQVNQTADTVFQPAFDALAQLHTDLTSGGPVQQTTIGQIQDGLTKLLDARAEAGARSNRLDETKNAQDGLVLDSKALLSQLEDVDMADAITELSQRQTTYEAALKVNSRVMQTSLLDYLR